MAASDADGRDFAPRNTPPRVIVLSSSPRRDGNSRLLAEALVYATPIWWYGVSGMLKTFIDRIFCTIAYSNPDSEEAVRRLRRQCAALLIPSLDDEHPFHGAAPLEIAKRYRFVVGSRFEIESAANSQQRWFILATGKVRLRTKKRAFAPPASDRRFDPKRKSGPTSQ